MSDEPAVTKINTDLVRAWVQLDEEHELQRPIKRRTLDKLFFAINNLIGSQASLQRALAGYVSSDADTGATQMELARHQNIEASNNLVQFLTEIMIAEKLG